MNRLVIVGGTDITPYINWKKYNIEAEEMYESWRDGNYVEHRIYIRSRMTGSFEVWLCGINDMDTDAFLALWNSATTNHVTTMAVYDQTINDMRAINAFCQITPSDHKQMMNGKFFDVFKIEVEER